LEQPDKPLLAAIGLQAGYGRKQVAFDVNLTVGHGEIVVLIGHNGAGKTTTLKTIFGMLAPLGGRVAYRGENITGLGCRDTVQRGMSLIPAERFVFGDLTVRENLLLGAVHASSAAVREQRRTHVGKAFPIVNERANQLANTLSGGQQRMLSLGLALMSNPRLLLLDEPSLGLAPALVAEFFKSLRSLADDEGLSVLLLEQNVTQALRIADRVYVMRAGRIILEETAGLMRARPNYWDLF
jgi:branched-chain amino acid transport system ATP-binding protein